MWGRGANQGQIYGVCRYGCSLPQHMSFFLSSPAAALPLQVMHPALLVQEVARAALSWVDSPATALAFALSSRVLAEAGLEAVWRNGDAWKLAMTIPELYRHVVVTDNGLKHVVSALRVHGGVVAEISVAAAHERFASRWVGGAAVFALRPVHTHSLSGAYYQCHDF